MELYQFFSFQLYIDTTHWFIPAGRRTKGFALSVHQVIKLLSLIYQDVPLVQSLNRVYVHVVLNVAALCGNAMLVTLLS